MLNAEDIIRGTYDGTNWYSIAIRFNSKEVRSRVHKVVSCNHAALGEVESFNGR